MKTRTIISIMVLFVLLLSFECLAATTDYPHQPIPFTKVKVTDTFWLNRLETNRTKTIPFAFGKCEETGRMENFKAAGGLTDSNFRGQFGFDDTDVYKVLEGASYGLMVKPDAEMDKYMDEVISYIAAAQEEDGYLYTAWTLKALETQDHVNCCYRQERWDNISSSHELYNCGHMYEAAVAHYTATGKKSFLEIATRSADLICDVFGPGKNEGVPGHQEIELGLAKLYRATGNEKYLNQAKWFLSQRGKSRQRSEYSQSHLPVFEQKEAVGHAVRANYMYSAMADVAAFTGDMNFLKAINTLWENVVDTKLYVTGGCGARHSGEAYGDNYELPNASAYCETCAAIANVYWNHRMFLMHGESKYIDVMERSLYNNVLSGVGLDGMSFFYPNPLESKHGNQRSPWFGCACCPSNVCRFIASVPGYVYAVKDDALYVNLFIDSKSKFKVGGNDITIKQTTEYPWNGKVIIEITGGKAELKIRVPDWARGVFDSSKLYELTETNKEKPQLLLNGKPVDMELKNGYASVKRNWIKGDTVEVSLPMPIQRIVCDERVQDNIGKTAIQCGPLVYCIEGCDIEGGNVINMMLTKDAKLTKEWKADLLGGINVISGNMVELYAQEGTDKFKRIDRKFKAIPYYGRSHRGNTSMAVWMPYSEERSTPVALPTIASESKISTSNFGGYAGPRELNSVKDGILPHSSSDQGKGYFHWWPRKGTTEWLQYDFKEAAEVSSVSVYWFDDTGHGECRLPKAWRILFKDGDQWKPVDNFTEYIATINESNTITFIPVKTEALRLEIQFPDRFSCGVQEWKVN